MNKISYFDVSLKSEKMPNTAKELFCAIRYMDLTGDQPHYALYSASTYVVYVVLSNLRLIVQLTWLWRRHCDNKYGHYKE